MSPSLDASGLFSVDVSQVQHSSCNSALELQRLSSFSPNGSQDCEMLCRFLLQLVSGVLCDLDLKSDNHEPHPSKVFAPPFPSKVQRSMLRCKSAGKRLIHSTAETLRFCKQVAAFTPTLGECLLVKVVGDDIDCFAVRFAMSATNLGKDLCVNNGQTTRHSGAAYFLIRSLCKRLLRCCFVRCS